MEDWVATEEEKGYDELVTESNEFYTVSYQYKDHTRSLTDSIQKYIINVENDSIIYFMDNLPEQWVPEVSGCVVANCCPNFPMGLIRSVLSVEKKDGMIKVVTLPAELEDAYEDFNLDMDTEIITDNSGVETIDSVNALIDDDDRIAAGAKSIGRNGIRTFMDNGTSLTRSGADGRDETVRRDWTMYNITKGYAKSPTRAVTRAVEDDYDKDIDKTEEKNSEFLIFELNGSSEIAKKIMEKYGKNVINQFSVGFYGITNTKIRKKVELKKKREYTDQTTTSGIKISYLVGHDFSKAKPGESTSTKATRMKQFLDWQCGKTGRNIWLTKPYGEKINLIDKVSNTALVVEVPLGTLPFGLLIRVKPILTPEIGIFGTGDVVIWTSKSRTVTDIVDGKKKEDDPKALDPPANEYDINLAGKIGITGGIEVFVGVGKKTSKNAAIGVGAYAEGNLNASLNLNKTFWGDCTLGQAENCLSITGNIKVGGKILAAGWGDYDFATKTWSFPLADKSYFPKFKIDDNLKIITGKDSKGDYWDVTLTYKLTDLGFHTSGVWRQYTVPYLYVYQNRNMAPDDPTPDASIKCSESVSLLYKNKDYTFKYRCYDMNAMLECVPVLINSKGEKQIYPAFSRLVTGAAKPCVRFITEEQKSGTLKGYHTHLYQMFGYQLSEIAEDDYLHSKYTKYLSQVPNDNYYFYEIAMPFELYNGTSVSKYWKDWGIEYTVYSSGSNRSFRGSQSFMSSIMKSGIYIPRIVVFSKKALNSGSYISANLYCTPIGKDNKADLFGSDQVEYTYEKYNYNKVSSSKRIPSSIDLKNNYEAPDYSWETEGKDISVFAGNDQ